MPHRQWQIYVAVNHQAFDFDIIEHILDYK